MSGPFPPVPPPAPGRQGGPPPGAMRPAPPPGHSFPPQMHPHLNSTRVVDITPQPILDEAACKKNLTSYLAFTMRKATPANRKEIPTWARAEVVEEKLTQSEITKQIKRLNDNKRKPVAEKKAALANFQQGQVSKLMDELAAKENDLNFEWSLVQLDREIRPSKQGSRKDKDGKAAKGETTTMTVYVMRSPLEGLNPIVLHQHIERMRMERFQQQNRPPPLPANQQQGRPQGQQGPQQQGQQQQGQQQQGPQQQGQQRQGQQPQGQQKQGQQQQGQPQKSQQQNGKQGGGNGPQIINLGRVPSKSPARRQDKRYNASSSSSSTSYSDTESDSELSASSFTTLSSKSRDDKRYRSPRRNRGASKPRVHHKEYYVDERSPVPTGRRLSGLYESGLPHRPVHAPEIPRQVPELDPVAAAYQAGKMDANAENFGLTERERFSTPPRQVVVERPVVIEQPRAVVSYGRPREFDAHYQEPPMSPYSEAGYSESSVSPRYMQERFIEGPREYRVERRDLRPEVREIRPELREFRPELRDIRVESREFAPPEHREFQEYREYAPSSDFLTREREAAEYIARTPFVERRTTEPRPPVSRTPNPFAPIPLRRRYSPSVEVGW